MNQEIKNINVNDCEVVKQKTLWEQLRPQLRDRLTYESETYNTCLVLVTKLKNMTSYFELTWGEILDIIMYAGIMKITTPEKIFCYDN